MAAVQKTRIFVDGQEGTTGLQIHQRLNEREDLELLEIDPDLRKDPKTRADLLNAADIAFLCLPDAAARESVSLLEPGNDRTRVIDASVAHRVAEGWVYGIPELSREQARAIQGSRRIANPGCHATGFVMLLTPLIAEGVIPRDLAAKCFSLTGYTGGGKKMIAQYEADPPDAGLNGPRPYALSLSHKHLAEMQKVTGLTQPPVFLPVVGNFARGMVVSVPLHRGELPEGATRERLHAALTAHYQGQPFVRVMPLDDAENLVDANFLDPLACNGTNRIDLFVFGNDDQMLLASRLDNLGKGAGGAAVQTMNLLMGIDETTGLDA
jgi:N-acetyl-gamma-glutamyl-phosphate reductase